MTFFPSMDTFYEPMYSVNDFQDATFEAEAGMASSTDRGPAQVMSNAVAMVK